MTPRPSELSLHLECEVQAPVSVVFGALTDPHQLAKWWGPYGFTTPSIELDLRVEGRYRIAMQPPEGEQFHVHGEFREIDPPHRLAYTFRWEEPDPDDVETVVTLSLVVVGAWTRLLVDQGVFATEPRRALHLDGWGDSLQRLEGLLSSAGADPSSPLLEELGER